MKTKAAQIFVATKIQAMQRGHLARSYLARLQIFVVFLQAAWRRYQVRNVLEDRRKARAAAVRDRACTSIIRLLRSKRLFYRLNKLVKGMRRLVARARGVQVRSKASKALKAIFQRMQAANLLTTSGPIEALKRQTRDSLNVLQHSTVLAEIVSSSHILREAVSTSLASCECLVQDNGPTVLLLLFAHAIGVRHTKSFLKCVLTPW